MPARLADIARVLEQEGYRVSEPTSGSHWRVFGDGMRRPFMIPAHNGMRTEIGDHVIHALCRALQLDRDAFRKRL